MTDKQRLDRALEARGLLASRARARDAVLRGTVRVNGLPARKPNQMVGENDAIALDDPAAAYVSRAALKLIAGLDAGAVPVAGRTCLDVGASTGGFTQVLLERGAARAFAVDVGHRQLHDDVRADPRVVVMEGVNARDLTGSAIPDPIDVLVCDVSFVSVTKVLAGPLALCRAGADAVVLIKPQFEVGRESIGGGGIVTNQAAIDAAVAEVITFMARQGLALRLTLASPISGGDGNREVVAVFHREG
jgi:23S rRNA (cytidine1920-2'-O)/16S rRNA (cytidine1409-2'-O)-methyltransferase